jgi:hypothetical protein
MPHCSFLSTFDAGKSYTIQGEDLSENSIGLLPQAVIDIFQRNGKAPEGMEIDFCCLEITDRKIRDLLLAQGDSKQHNGPERFTGKYGKSSQLEVRIREDRATGRVFCDNVQQHRLKSVHQALSLLKHARMSRKVAPTQLNEKSSRGHAMYTITVRKPRHRVGAQLTIVDMAGIERPKKSKVTGERLRETCRINSQLMHITRVLRVMKWNQDHPGRKRVVPFRESKLTQLLQPALSGLPNGRNGGHASKVVVLLTASPGPLDFDEKLASIKEVAGAQQVRICRQPVAVAPPPTLKVNVAAAPPRPPGRDTVLSDAARTGSQREPHFCEINIQNNGQKSRRAAHDIAGQRGGPLQRQHQNRPHRNDPPAQYQDQGTRSASSSDGALNAPGVQSSTQHDENRHTGLKEFYDVLINRSSVGNSLMGSVASSRKADESHNQTLPLCMFDIQQERKKLMQWLKQAIKWRHQAKAAVKTNTVVSADELARLIQEGREMQALESTVKSRLWTLNAMELITANAPASECQALLKAGKEGKLLKRADHEVMRQLQHLASRGVHVQPAAVNLTHKPMPKRVAVLTGNNCNNQHHSNNNQHHSNHSAEVYEQSGYETADDGALEGGQQRRQSIDTHTHRQIDSSIDTHTHRQIDSSLKQQLNSTVKRSITELLSRKDMEIENLRNEHALEMAHLLRQKEMESQAQLAQLTRRKEDEMQQALEAQENGLKRQWHELQQMMGGSSSSSGGSGGSSSGGSSRSSSSSGRGEVKMQLNKLFTAADELSVNCESMGFANGERGADQTPWRKFASTWRQQREEETLRRFVVAESRASGPNPLYTC